MLNMCKILELSELFVSLGGRGVETCSVFQSLGGQKKLLDCGLLGGVSTQADTMSSDANVLHFISLWAIISPFYLQTRRKYQKFQNTQKTLENINSHFCFKILIIGCSVA